MKQCVSFANTVHNFNEQPRDATCLIESHYLLCIPIYIHIFHHIYVYIMIYVYIIYDII